MYSRLCRNAISCTGKKTFSGSRGIKIALGVLAVGVLLACGVVLIAGSVKKGGRDAQGLAHTENVVRVKWTADDMEKKCAYVLEQGHVLLKKMQEWTGDKLGLLHLMNQVPSPLLSDRCMRGCMGRRWQLSIELDNMSSMTGLLKAVAPEKDVSIDAPSTRVSSNACALHASTHTVASAPACT